MTPRKMLARMAVAATFAAAMLATVAVTPAAAAPAKPTPVGTETTCPRGEEFTDDGVRIRSGPFLFSTVLGLGYAGQDVIVYGGAWGDVVNGDSRWWYLKNQATGVVGYVARGTNSIGCR